MLVAVSLACGDDGSGGDTNTAENSETGGDSTGGMPGEGESTAAPESTSSSSTSEGTDPADDSTTTGDDPEPTGDDPEPTGDDTSSGGEPIIECPDRAQTCESLAPLFHCDTAATTGFCLEYLHECLPVAELEAGCGEVGGTLGEGACPTVDALGTCIASTELQFASVVYPVPGYDDAAVAEQDCLDGGGTWCPG